MGEAAAIVKVCPQCGMRYFRGEFFCPHDAARLNPASGPAPTANSNRDSLLDTLVGGRYRLVARIGEGGMGLVYKAHHIGIDRAVAVKVLRSDLSTNLE